MSTSIPEVANVNIAHALLVDLQLGSSTYKISNAYRTVSQNDPTLNPYKGLGGFLQCGQITENIKSTTGDLQLSLSGIPVDRTGSGDDEKYLELVLTKTIKGGNVTINRAFFDTTSGQITNTYQRFKGIITGYSVSEEVDTLNGINSATVVVTAASTLSVLENQITGQRTNEVDRKRFFPTDTIMDRVKDLNNVQFDFGREFNSTGGSGGGGGGGGGGGNRRNRYKDVQER